MKRFVGGWSCAFIVSLPARERGLKDERRYNDQKLIQIERTIMAKLGSKKKPAVARVQTEKRAGEIMRICNERGWQVIVGIEPDKPEDISDIKWLLKNFEKQPRPQIRSGPLKVSPNDYCPCGSGLKYKKCCFDKV